MNHPQSRHDRAVARQIAERRRSNAAGIHEDRRTRRNRSRQIQKQTAIREQAA